MSKKKAPPRNFWIELLVDGKKKAIRVGTKLPNEGFKLTIYQADHNKQALVLKVQGYVLACGNSVQTITTVTKPSKSVSNSLAPWFQSVKLKRLTQKFTVVAKQAAA